MKVLFILFIIILLGVVVIYRARGPVFSEKTFPSSGIIEFKQFTERVRQEMPDEITVMTYNIGYGSAEKNNKPEALSEEEVRKNLDAMVASLKELGPDIIFLQEVDFNAARTFGIDQMRYLAEGLAMPFAAFAVTWNKRYIPWPYWPPAVHFGRMLSGQAILSRFPIEGQTIVRFDKPQANSFWYNWFYLDRVGQKVSLAVGDGVWNVWNLHLEAYDEATREKQLARMAKELKGDNHLMLAAGDYNEQRVDTLREFSRLSGLQSSGYALDYVFYADKFTLVDKGYQDCRASDHFPVWAQFKRSLQ